MVERKYEFTGETRELGGTLLRIRAVRDFGDVKAGDPGGWIEKEENLSHDGNCWAYDEAQIFDNAQVRYDAKIKGYSRVYDNAQILGEAVINNSHVCDDAVVRHRAHIEGRSLVCRARIYGSTLVFRSTISNCAYIHDSVIKKVEISVPCSIFRGHIMSDRDLLTIGPIGSEDGILTAYRTTQDGLWVQRGCFKGSLAEFSAAVEQRHGNNRHGRVYRSAIDFICSYFGEEVKQS